MALDYTSDNITNKKYTPPSAPHSARECYQAIGTAAVDDSLDTGHLVGLVVLPANCIPTDCVLANTGLGGGILVTVGILDTTTNDLVSSSLLMTESNVCAIAGAGRMDSDECAFNPATWLAEADCPGINEDKIVALKVTTGAGTAAAGTISFMLNYRSAENGV